MIESGAVLQNRYRIERQIGEGGMGAVYLAVDERFGSFVALKETFYHDDKLRRAFEREARLLNNLHHPVLPHVSDYFVESDKHFLVMEHIAGDDLAVILKRDGAFPLADVLRWTEKLLDALDYLHSHTPPIIHRDIKPANLKLTARGDIILLDFGLAKQIFDEDQSNSRSLLGYSRTYSPLEQIQGTGTDQRADIFALGATVFHLLIGKAPVNAVTRAASIVAEKPDPIRLASEIDQEIPHSVAMVINTALALNAENRFASAREMSEALQRAAVRAEQPENELSQPTAARIAAGTPIIMDAALTAFAAEIEKAAAHTSSSELSLPASKIVLELRETVAPSNEPKSPRAVVVNEAATEVRAAPKPRSLVWPVVIAAAAFGGLLFLVYSHRAPTAATTAQIQQNSQNSNAAKPKVDENSIEPTAQTQIKPAPETTVSNVSTAKRQTVKRRETKEIKTDNSATKKIGERAENVEPPLSAAVEPAKTASPERPRAVTSKNQNASGAPVSGVEQVLTGANQRGDGTTRPRRVAKPRAATTDAETLRRQRTADILRRNRGQ